MRFSNSALQAKFVEIAKAEGFAITDFKEAVLCYEFPMQLDDYSSNCYVSIISNSGYSVTKAVDYAGNGAEMINENTEPTDAAAASRGQ